MKISKYNQALEDDQPITPPSISSVNLPSPLPESVQQSIRSSRLAIMVENEKLRRRNLALTNSICKLESEVKHLRNSLNQTHRDLTRHRYNQFEANSHFEMFLKDVGTLSDRYRRRTISNTEEALLNSDVTDDSNMEEDNDAA